MIRTKPGNLPERCFWCAFTIAVFAFWAFVLFLMLSPAKAEAVWDHTVIMFPPPGATFTVPLSEGRNCIWVNNCGDDPTTEPEPPPDGPPPISEIPTPRGTPGWTFGVLIDAAGWLVTASTEHATEDAANAIDGDPMTIWRSGSAGRDETGVFPHELVIDLGKEHWVDGMIYVPRPYDSTVTWSENGSIADYEVWVSDNYVAAHAVDGKPVAANGTWGRVANGTFTYERPGEPQKIEFLIPNLARWVKLVALSDSKGTNIAAASEIYLSESLRDVEITGGGVQ